MIYVKISLVFRVVLLYHSKYIRKSVNTGILKQITHHDSCMVSITHLGDTDTSISSGLFSMLFYIFKISFVFSVLLYITQNAPESK